VYFFYFDFPSHPSRCTYFFWFFDLANETIAWLQSRIDLDQYELKRYLSLGTKEGLGQAHLIYQKGIHSYPVATLTITSATGGPQEVPQGALIIGMSETKRVVYGIVTMDHHAQETRLMVSYDTSGDRGNYIPCEVGGNPLPFTEGCEYDLCVDVVLFDELSGL
jgi:hypothetical protein